MYVLGKLVEPGRCAETRGDVRKCAVMCENARLRVPVVGSVVVACGAFPAFVLSSRVGLALTKKKGPAKPDAGPFLHHLVERLTW